MKKRYYIGISMVSVILCLLNAGSFSCSAYEFFKSTSTPERRTFSVKIVADRNFAHHSLWEKNARNLVENASRFYRSWLDVTFEIDTLAIWEPKEVVECVNAYPWDCLLERVPRGNADIVVFFTRKSTNPHGRIAGLSMYTDGYVMVEQNDWSNTKAGYEKAFHVLIHELGHVFGAVHVYGRDNAVNVMNPYVSDHLVEKRGMAYEYVEPGFHESNLVIMTSLLDRPFGEDAWKPEYWWRIRDAYDNAFDRNNPQGFENGNVVGVGINALHEEAKYLYLSSWAALCGYFPAALGYIDSTEILFDNIWSVCKNVGYSASLCRRYSSYSSGAGVEEMKAALNLQRARIYLGAGDFASADSCMQELAQMPGLELSQRSKLQRGFRIAKERAKRSAEVVISDEPPEVDAQFKESDSPAALSDTTVSLGNADMESDTTMEEQSESPENPEGSTLR